MVEHDDLYRLAVEEYRFQATFNWSRTQYLLGFNAGIVTAGAILAGTTTTKLSALVFGLGLVAALLSIEVVRVQHSYYRAARDHMRTIEVKAVVPTSDRLDTTSSMGGRRRFASVNQLVYFLLAAIAVFDVIGMVSVLLRPVAAVAG